MQVKPETKSSPADLMAGLWTPERIQIRRWLTERGAPSFAELYEGAVTLLHTKPPAYVRFVAHAVRDIINGLPAQITGSERRREQYESLVDNLMEAWDRERLPRSLTISAPQAEKVDGEPLPGVRLSRRLTKLILRVFDEREQGKVRRENNPYIFFEVCAPENRERRDLLRPLVAEWVVLHREFQQLTHESGDRDIVADSARLEAIFPRFENALQAFASSFYDSIRNLDEILDQANT